MSIFKSAFEKLSLQNQESIKQSSAYVASAVSPEGSLFGIFVNMENHLKKIAENTDPSQSKAAKIDAKGAKALGTAMPGIGEGFMLIAEALNLIPDSKDAEAKMQAITGGIDALKGLGMAIFKFAGMLALSLPLLILGIPALLIAVPMVLLIGGMFYLLDKMNIERSIKKVSIGLTFAGLAIVTLGAAFTLFEMLAPPIEQIFQIGAVVLGTALIFGIAGKFAGSIAQGALVMALAAVPIYLIAASFALFRKAVPPDSEGWTTIGQVSAVVVGLGLAMAGAGAAAVLIAPGAASMVLAGVALIALAAGLSAIATVFKPGKFDYLLADSGHETEGFLGFGGGRMMSNMEWALFSVARSFAIPPTAIAAMYVGAPALMMSGLALVAIAKGIEKFQAMDIDYNVLPMQINKVTTVLGDAFGAIGKKYPGGGGGFISAMFGSGGGTSAVAQGISAVSGMGRALTGIATGVQAMADLKFPTKFDKNGNPIEFRTLKDDDFIKVTINTQKIVKALSGTFGKIGDSPEAKDNWGWFGNSAVEEGIQIVKKMGDPLVNLAEFVSAFAKEDVDVDAVTNKTRKLIGSLTSIFVNEEGANLSARDISLYARSYDDMADAVEDMAEGMEDWKDALNGLDLEKVTEVRKLYEGLAALSNNGDTNIVEEMGQSMIDAIQLLSDKLGEFAGTMKGVSPTASSPTTGAVTQSQSEAAVIQNSEQLVSAIDDLKRALTGTLDVYVTNTGTI